jgi:hypothetical protein
MTDEELEYLKHIVGKKDDINFIMEKGDNNELVRDETEKASKEELEKLVRFYTRLMNRIFHKTLIPPFKKGDKVLVSNNTTDWQYATFLRMQDETLCACQVADGTVENFKFCALVPEEK